VPLLPARPPRRRLAVTALALAWGGGWAAAGWAVPGGPQDWIADRGAGLVVPGAVALASVVLAGLAAAGLRKAYIAELVTAYRHSLATATPTFPVLADATAPAAPDGAAQASTPEPDAAVVNVARRSLVLLGRQLALVDRLERSELDPDTLDTLFQLDHLATRMRRYAESLLIVAGSDTGRSARAPMPLSDAVRAAVSGVEQYQRVDLDIDPRLDAVGIVAHRALPVAHLLAELLDNATAYSDPTTRVRVTVEAPATGAEFPGGTSSGTGTTAGPVRVTVEDRGFGMSDDELARAQAAVSDSPQAPGVAAAQLGLQVVGRLAARIGAVVGVERVPAGGIRAVVDVPTDLMTTVSSAAATMSALLPPLAPATPMPSAPPPAVARPAPPAPFTRTAPTSIDAEPVVLGAVTAPPLVAEPLPRQVPAEPPAAGPALPEPATVQPTLADPASGRAPLPRRRDLRRAREEALNEAAPAAVATEPSPAAQAPADDPGALRRRHALASEALSELSMLSAYRPDDRSASSPAGPNPPLQRRQRTDVPAPVPPPVGGPGGGPDPETTRSLLTGFTEGARRAHAMTPAPEERP
jgi:signal transduction histidine kinase